MPLREQEVPRNDAGLAQGLSAPARLEALPGVAIERVAETGSTQSDLLERHAGPGAPPLHGAVLRVAGRQTQGRGRHGRRWLGESGAALTFSFARVVARADLGALSLAVGVTLAEALAARFAAGAPRLALKWPNDLVLLDAPAPAAHWRKLGGILIETSSAPGGRLVVVGVGLNVGAPPEGVAEQATGCVAEGWPGADPETVLAVLAPALAAALQAFEAQGFDAAWRARYARLDALEGVALVAGSVRGVGAGIAADGSLRLRTEDGEIVAVASGEVRVRAGSAAPTEAAA